MAVEVAGTIFRCSHPLLSRCRHTPRTIAFALSSFISTCSTSSPDRPFASQQSPFLGALHLAHRKRNRGLRRAYCGISLDGFDDSYEKGELAFEPQIDAESHRNQGAESSGSGDDQSTSAASCSSSSEDYSQFVSPVSYSISPLPSWITSEFRRLPAPRQSVEDADTICSSVKKAFSSMVFIIREMQGATIRMREAFISSPNFQIHEILARVQSELHASFVWLFQRIFSATPTLMIYLMLLLANFTVFSIADPEVTAVLQPPLQAVSSALDDSRCPTPRFDSSSVKTFHVGRSAAFGGSGGGGGGASPTLSGAADDGQSSLLSFGSIPPDAFSSATEEEETSVWNGILEEAERMRASSRHEALLDPDTLRRFVPLVTVEAEPEDFSAFWATEISYRRALAENPDDPLLLANFAQFLYIVLRDHDRAEEYFKKAVKAEPADVEALSRYANFLWVARKDLGAAEETFLEAIEADPGNSYHSANYAHFLWSTGGEDTCYPLDTCDT